MNPNEISAILTEQFGMGNDVEISNVHDGLKIVIRPSGLVESISFSVIFHLGWRRVSGTFKPGAFASDLLRGMTEATLDKRIAFSVFANSLKNNGAEIDFSIGLVNVDPEQPDQWPEKWPNISICMRKVGVMIENDSDYDLTSALPWITGFFGMSLSLLPLEGDPIEVDGHNFEGNPSSSLVKRYERSRLNRAVCIEIHGSLCKICGFDFETTYGEYGRGFIHVHHIMPLSEMGGEYVLNPKTDLIPICPNCHAMIHRQRPALDISDLREMLVKKTEGPYIGTIVN